MAPCTQPSYMAGLGSKSIGTTLQSELRRATEEASSLEVPKETLLAIVQSSHDEADRREIMRHLASCLCDMRSARWRSVNASLVVLEELFRRGSSDLVSETANGFHFDLVQRMSFLEKYEYGCDLRVQQIVRQKAHLVRTTFLKLQSRLEGAEARRSHRVRSLAKFSYGTHSDDTTDDESDEESLAQPQVTPPVSLSKFSYGTHRDDTSDDESEDEALRSRGGALSDEGDSNSSSSGNCAGKSKNAEGSQQGHCKFMLGDLCRSVAVVTMREGESFDSKEIAEYSPGVMLVLLEIGAGRRVKARVLGHNQIGWVSVRTKLDEPLIEVCNASQVHGLLNNRH